MLKKRTKRKQKVLKVMHFQNMKIGNYKVSKTEKGTNVIDEVTLEKYVRDRNLLELSQIYNITLSLCETITNLKSLNYNITYSQLDPANIIVSKNEKVLIKDWEFSSGLLINGNTVPYLPNFVSSYVKQQSIQQDSSGKVICSIGMLIYYMAIGKTLITSIDPFLEDSYSSNTDSNLKRIIQKCLHIDMKKRYVSIEELKNEIIIELLKKSKFRKKENIEDNSDTSRSIPEYQNFKRVDKYKRKKNSIFSRISSTLSTFF